MNCVFFLFVFCLILSLSRCDLPIHALMGDVYGTWNLIETKNMSDYPETCGGDIPNTNEQNLKLKNYKNFLNRIYGTLEELKVKLTLEKTKANNEVKPRDTWTFLAVRDYDTDKIIGQWTMVYDEGFEIRIKEKKYFGFFKYQKNSTHNCPKSMEDPFMTNGNILCYSTDPTKIHMGWVVDKKMDEVLKEQKMYWGCFYAEKEEDTNVTTYVLHNSSSNHMHIERNDANISNIPDNKTFSVSSKRAGYKKIRVLDTPKDYGSSKTDLRNIFDSKENNIYACKKSDQISMKIELNMPKHFSWGDPYSNEDYEEHVDDQKMCGSCYAITSSFSLQKRFEIMFLKKYNKKVTMPKLSYQSLLSCSPFNQGCDGGYPFLVGKQMQEFGIATESCMKNYNIVEDEDVCKMDMGKFNLDFNEKEEEEEDEEGEEEYNNNNNNNNNYNNKQKTNMRIRYKENNGVENGVQNEAENGVEVEEKKKRKDKFCTEIYYASDYYYVGGCYECTNEYDMMNEVLLNGPIIVAIDAKPNLLHFYNANKNEIYTEKSEENKVCDIIDKGFNGWQFTNHAVNIVGWGEETDENNKLIKYWIIRNTWGKNWGYKGYMKVQRGINLAGIETQAVYIDPDFTRGHAQVILNEYL